MARAPHIHPMKQHGMSLVFALLALVALSLGAVALIRSVDTGALVLGNLGFKQDATAAADQGTEDAIAWLSAQSSDVLNSNSNSDAAHGGRMGYYASSHDGIAVTGQQNTGAAEMIDWEGNDCHGSVPAASCLDPYSMPADSVTNGALVQYAIFRLCNTTGAITTDSACAKPTTSTGASTKRGKLDYADYARFGSVAGPYYRIVVRSVGGRNTTSFTETIVHF